MTPAPVQRERRAWAGCPLAPLDNLRRFVISATTSLRRVLLARLDVSIAEAKCLSDLRINIVGSAKKCHDTPLNVR